MKQEINFEYTKLYELANANDQLSYQILQIIAANISKKYHIERVVCESKNYFLLKIDDSNKRGIAKVETINTKINEQKIEYKYQIEASNVIVELIIKLEQEEGNVCYTHYYNQATSQKIVAKPLAALINSTDKKLFKRINPRIYRIITKQLPNIESTEYEVKHLTKQQFEQIEQINSIDFISQLINN